MKKSLTLPLALVALLGITGIANAQIFPFTASTSVTATPTVVTSTTSTTTSTTVTTTDNGSVLGASTTALMPTTTTPTVPTLVTVTMPASGYIQFNNLVVSGTTSVTAPAMITAGNTPGGTSNMLGLGTCMAFATQTSAVGTSVTCPVPTATVINNASTTASSTIGASTTITTTPTNYAPYQIEIDPTTQILLSDRSAGSLANIVTGDQINVFGYYNVNGDGSIQASIVRDLSKPATPSGLLPVTTPLPSGTSTSGITTTPSTTVTGTLSIAQIITEIQQIEQAITQLSALIAANNSTTVSSSTVTAPMIPATTSTVTTTVPSTTAAPMIPAPAPTAPTTAPSTGLGY